MDSEEFASPEGAWIPVDAEALDEVVAEASAGIAGTAGGVTAAAVVEAMEIVGTGVTELSANALVLTAAYPRATTPAVATSRTFLLFIIFSLS